MVLHKIKREEIKEVSQDRDAFKSLVDSNEPIYWIQSTETRGTDPLVEVEIALRKGKRVGLFRG